MRACFCVCRGQGKPELMVGSHRLIGKVEKFKQPLAIMSRKRTRDGEEVHSLGDDVQVRTTPSPSQCAGIRSQVATLRPI